MQGTVARNFTTLHWNHQLGNWKKNCEGKTLLTGSLEYKLSADGKPNVTSD
jgi:hypothetical protein